MLSITFNSEPNIIGKRVKITDPAKYKGTCLGQYGTVRLQYGNNIAVDVDFMSNQASEKGYYYFKIRDLEIVETEKTERGENNMQKMSDYVNVAVVRFLKGNNLQAYEYANYINDLVVGDVCVVMSAHHGLGLAEVVEIKEHASEELYREIVSKVDTTDYDQRVERRKKAAELKAKMQERAKQLQDIVLYQTLAKEDPAMAEMLQEYMKLK